MRIEEAGLEDALVREWWEAAQAGWIEAERIQAEELTDEELERAATNPDGVAEAIAALAPVVARHVHPDVLPAIAAIVGSSAPGSPPPRTIEECPETLTAEELSARVRRLERTLSAAGRWLSEGSTGVVLLGVAAALSL